MKTTVVFFPLVVFLLAGSDARPIWPLRASPEAIHSSSSSSVSLPSGNPPSAEQLAVQEYRDQRLDEYTDSTLTNLFDEHDIVPDEHVWWGEDTPFNIEEYFRITPHEELKKGWKKFFEGVRGFFSPNDKITGEGIEENVMTTYGTDGTVKGDKVSPFAFGKKKGKSFYPVAKEISGSGWSGRSDEEKKYTMHGAKEFS